MNKLLNPDSLIISALRILLLCLAFHLKHPLSLSTIQKWERGLLAPKGASLKLLNLVEQKGIEILV